MDRAEFLAQPNIAGFVAWLAERLPTLPVQLRFARSKFVPNGLDVLAVGIESVLARYHWQAHWCDPRTGGRVVSGDWESTRESLARLSDWLRSSVKNRNDVDAEAAAREVLRWGGVRGAVPFIRSKVREEKWCEYLSGLAPLFALTGTQRIEALNSNNVERFDSGLTKIHSLLDKTGSPIYDSRVGAALAMLYELFRRDATVRHDVMDLPSGQARGRQIRDPGELGFAASPQLHTPRVRREAWARWQLKAGWIIRAVVERTDLFSTEPAGSVVDHMAARCHAFEAALFMVGYDLRSLVAEGVETAIRINVQSAVAAPKAELKWVPSSHNFSVVLKAYREYRETLPFSPSIKGLKAWLDDSPQASKYAGFKGAFPSYSYPLRETEMDMNYRSLAEVQAIENGGEGALAVLTDGELSFVSTDEREQVCLVDAGLAGYCQLIQTAGESSTARLIKAGFAGTANSASTLLYVGRGVGRHFGLLDDGNHPTELFYRFYGDGFDYFRGRLGVSKDGKDL